MPALGTEAHIPETAGRLAVSSFLRRLGQEPPRHQSRTTRKNPGSHRDRESAPWTALVIEDIGVDPYSSSPTHCSSGIRPIFSMSLKSPVWVSNSSM